MKFEYLKNLRGPNGEWFSEEPVDIRLAKKDEWYLHEKSARQAYTDHKDREGASVILRRLKTAREWLAELPDGWREEALAHGHNLDCTKTTLVDAVLDCVSHVVKMDWVDKAATFDHCPSGTCNWIIVMGAIRNGKSIPLYPSTVKPAKKIVRLQVTRLANGLVGGSLPIQDWLGRADFRGFVFVLPDGKEVVASVTLIWANLQGGWSFVHSDPCPIGLRPSFVEFEQ